MSIYNSNKKLQAKPVKNIIFEALCNIQCGSLTVIKQDNTVIQVNINERIKLEDTGNDNLGKELEYGLI